MQKCLAFPCRQWFSSTLGPAVQTQEHGIAINTFLGSPPPQHVLSISGFL